MTFEFFTPAHIIVGAEALSKAAVHWRQKGKKALVVTDEMMVSLGNAARVTKHCNRMELPVKCFPVSMESRQM